MILQQFFHSDPVSISYFIGRSGFETGAVSDLVAEVSCYLEAAEAAGVKIDYVIDTHVHADHISTGPALAAISGAKYVLSAHADVAIPFMGVADGCEIKLGNVVIEALHTPGHTPEHICLLVADQTRSAPPPNAAAKRAMNAGS